MAKNKFDVDESLEHEFDAAHLKRALCVCEPSQMENDFCTEPVGNFGSLFSDSGKDYRLCCGLHHSQ